VKHTVLHEISKIRTLTAVAVKRSVFRDTSRGFGWTFRLLLQGRRTSRARYQRQCRRQTELFLLGFFSPEDRGDMSLRKSLGSGLNGVTSQRPNSYMRFDFTSLAPNMEAKFASRSRHLLIRLHGITSRWSNLNLD
jgi:hypothetical protein